MTSQYYNQDVTRADLVEWEYLLFCLMYWLWLKNNSYQFWAKCSSLFCHILSLSFWLVMYYLATIYLITRLQILCCIFFSRTFYLDKWAASIWVFILLVSLKIFPVHCRMGLLCSRFPDCSKYQTRSFYPSSCIPLTLQNGSPFIILMTF